MSRERPIIVVTGANRYVCLISSLAVRVLRFAQSGVGLGICQRLLQQLSQAEPSDAQPQFVPLDPKARAGAPSATTQAYDGLTLILACRNEQRALAARRQLLNGFDSHIAKERTRQGYNGHAEKFKENLSIEFHPVDMADIGSVFQFCRVLSQKYVLRSMPCTWSFLNFHRYPYISHLICNAGGAVFIGIDWLRALRQLIWTPIIGVTVTEFKLQRSGVIGHDGLGLVWQSNVFSHYVLVSFFSSAAMTATEGLTGILFSHVCLNPCSPHMRRQVANQVAYCGCPL